MRKLEKLEQSDLDNLEMLKTVILAASHDLKGDAIVKVASLIVWYNKFKEKCEDVLKNQVMEEAKKGAPKITKPKSK